MTIDLVKLNGVLCSCIRLVVATKRLIKEYGVELPNLNVLERCLRESASEVQQGIVESKNHGNRPLFYD